MNADHASTPPDAARLVASFLAASSEPVPDAEGDLGEHLVALVLAARAAHSELGLNLPPAELESLMGVLRSRLDLSLSSAFPEAS